MRFEHVGVGVAEVVSAAGADEGDPGGDGPLESVIIGTHQSGHMLQFFDRIVSYGEEGLAPHLREYVHETDPESIAINRSRTVSMADGMTAELLR